MPFKKTGKGSTALLLFKLKSAGSLPDFFYLAHDRTEGTKGAGRCLKQGLRKKSPPRRVGRLNTLLQERESMISRKENLTRYASCQQGKF